jgi:hypothetical protein
MPARRRHAEQVGTDDTHFGEDVSRTLFDIRGANSDATSHCGDCGKASFTALNGLRRYPQLRNGKETPPLAAEKLIRNLRTAANFSFGIYPPV